jgi:hypothetical protein
MICFLDVARRKTSPRNILGVFISLNAENFLNEIFTPDGIQEIFFVGISFNSQKQVNYKSRYTDIHNHHSIRSSPAKRICFSQGFEF